MNSGTLLILGLIAIGALVLVLFILIRSGSRGDDIGERMLAYATVPEYLQ